MSPRPQPGKTLMEALFGKPSSTPPPSKEQKLKDENWKLAQENSQLRTRVEYYNNAVRSIVMRLRVLDIAKLKEEMGPDGTIPMRMMVSELEALNSAYDGKMKYKYLTTATDSPSLTPSEAPF